MFKFLVLALFVTVASAAFEHHGDNDFNAALIPINVEKNNVLSGILGSANTNKRSFYKYRTLKGYGYRNLPVDIPVARNSDAFNHKGDGDLNAALVPINASGNNVLSGILGSANTNKRSFYKYRTFHGY